MRLGDPRAWYRGSVAEEQEDTMHRDRGLASEGVRTPVSECVLCWGEREKKRNKVITSCPIVYKLSGFI
jgi:hypothetical protein